MFLYLSNDLIILSVSATRHPANIVHNSELQVTSPDNISDYYFYPNVSINLESLETVSLDSCDSI